MGRSLQDVISDWVEKLNNREIGQWISSLSFWMDEEYSLMAVRHPIFTSDVTIYLTSFWLVMDCHCDLSVDQCFSLCFFYAAWIILNIISWTQWQSIRPIKGNKSERQLWIWIFCLFQIPLIQNPAKTMICTYCSFIKDEYVLAKIHLLISGTTDSLGIRVI